MTLFKIEEPIQPNSALYFRNIQGALVLDESENYFVNRYIENIGFDYRAGFFDKYEDFVRKAKSNFCGCKTVNTIRNFGYLTNTQQRFQQHLQKKAGATQLLDDQSVWIVDGYDIKWRKDSSTKVESLYVFYRDPIADHDLYKMVQYEKSKASRFAPSAVTFNVVEENQVGLLYEEMHESGVVSLVLVCAGSSHINF